MSLAGGLSDDNIIGWKSKKCPVLCGSTTSAELHAAKMSSKRLYKYTETIEKLWGKAPRVHHYTDNLPLVQCFQKRKFEEEPSLNGALCYTLQNLAGVGAEIHWVRT